MALVECVPNFSDGRDASVAAAIQDAIRSVTGTRLLDWHSDPDHHRSVATFAGDGPAVSESAFRAIAVASRRIDLSTHQGVHPRMGATDVCPFVPLVPEELPICVELAHGLGRRVADELAIPVYFYGAAALRPERRALPEVRRGGFEALREAVASEPARAPDVGPRRLHPTAGATAVGARGFLVAFNVNLETSDIGVARAIARSIREVRGGLPGIRALGFPLASAGIVQVSINVCEPSRTGLRRVFDEVQRLAGERGVAVRDSELVGLAPRSALDADVARAVRLRGFEARRHVLEEALAAP